MSHPSLHLLSRALVALIFLLSGFGKIANFTGTAGFMAAAGMPFPQLFLIAAIAVEIGAGAALLLGFQTRWAALSLAGFLVPATIIFHALPMADPAHAQEQMVQVLKNLAIIGGLLKFALDGPGAFALDHARLQPGATFER